MYSRNTSNYKEGTGENSDILRNLGMLRGGSNMIIAAHAGTGKTTLAKMYPDRVADLVAMPYKYYLSQDFDSIEEETIKANPDIPMHDDWPYNYIEAIKENMSSGKILLIPPDSMVRWMLMNENIPYTLCYPQRDAKEIYRQRYLKRGNTEDFLRVFIDRWDVFLDLMEGDTYAQHIVMLPHQFLSDVIEEGLIG